MPSVIMVHCTNCGEYAVQKARQLCAACYAKWWHAAHPTTRREGDYLPSLTRTPANATRCRRCEILIAPNRMFTQSYDGLCRWCYDAACALEQRRAAA